MTGGNPERSHSYLGRLGRNRREEWWSCYAARNSAALMAEASGKGSMQDKESYLQVNKIIDKQPKRTAGKGHDPLTHR